MNISVSQCLNKLLYKKISGKRQHHQNVQEFLEVPKPIIIPFYLWAIIASQNAHGVSWYVIVNHDKAIAETTKYINSLLIANSL